MFASPTRDLHSTRARADTAEVTESNQQRHGEDADVRSVRTGSDPQVDGVAATELQFSSSPRKTWLWAPDEATAGRVRELTGCGPARQGGHEVPLVTDVSIGMDAYAACQILVNAGHTFTWHESVHPLNRNDWPSELPGMPRAQGSPA